jgi:hypothetical protein
MPFGTPIDLIFFYGYSLHGYPALVVLRTASCENREEVTP